MLEMSLVEFVVSLIIAQVISGIVMSSIAILVTPWLMKWYSKNMMKLFEDQAKEFENM